jgi:DNA mismatch repair protein MutS
MLEDASLMQRGQSDLFASTPAQAGAQSGPAEPDALRQALDAVSPDELTPREALELLYRLKRL